MELAARGPARLPRQDGDVAGERERALGGRAQGGRREEDQGRRHPDRRPRARASQARVRGLLGYARQARAGADQGAAQRGRRPEVKAIQFSRFGPPAVLKLEEVPTPVPGTGEVLVAIEAASVTPGDTKLRAGLLQSIFSVSLPCIPGRDGAGRIAAAGREVDYARVGDPVCFVAERTVQGSYATHIVRDAHSIVPLPAKLSFAEGAALMHAGTCAWIALVDTAGLQPGQRLLVHGGSGAIGGMAVQIARHP